jgi:hypothetical protein
MEEQCGTWYWWQSQEEYCSENPKCKDCPQQASGGGGLPKSRLLAIAPREVNQQAALLTLMLTKDYREVLKDRPVLTDAFRISVLPHILRGNGMQLLDEFARSLYGDDYSSDQLAFASYFDLFSTLRIDLGKLVQAVEKKQPSDQARDLMDFFKQYGLEVDEVQACDLTRVGTRNPRIAKSCAALLANRNELEAALTAYSHVIDLAQVDSDSIELTKEALDEQTGLLKGLSRGNEINRLEAFKNSLP